MKKHVISCYPSGTVEAVQNDEIPLHSLGRSQMERASDVVWEEADQKWYGIIRPEFRHGTPFVFIDADRSLVIEAEIEYLNNR